MHAYFPIMCLGMICVVKADAYGHGAIPVSRHLKAHGAERLAVATVAEGVQLRQADLPGPIHVLGEISGGSIGERPPVWRFLDPPLKITLICICLFGLIEYLYP